MLPEQVPILKTVTRKQKMYIYTVKFWPFYNFCTYICFHYTRLFLVW